MMNKLLLRCLPALMGLALVGAPAPAQAQGGDAGVQLEQQMGVLGSNSREGRRLNAQLDEIVDRITGAVNERRDGGTFRLRSAKILGGRSAKHDEMVNAFALPDGRIYVTLGLMRLVQSSPYAEDEIAFVVGHEITHVAQKHSANQMKKSMPANILAVLLGAVTKNETLGTVARYGAAAYSSHFSREDEYRADKGGLQAMHRAGYNPNAAVTMLERLGRLGGTQNRTINGWFGSHPISENRVARVKEMIQDLRADGRVRDRSGDFQEVRPRRRRR